MPLGDPHGGNFQYTDEGLPLSTAIASIPSPDPGKAKSFYTGTLMMDVIMEDGDQVLLKRGECVLRLYRSGTYGVDTGIFIGVDDPYHFRRRMMDEGVMFHMPPTKTELGVILSFLDDDRNVLYVTSRAPTVPGARPAPRNPVRIISLMGIGRA